LAANAGAFLLAREAIAKGVDMISNSRATLLMGIVLVAVLIAFWLPPIRQDSVRIGLILVALGSGSYHLPPSDATFFWDLNVAKMLCVRTSQQYRHSS
jgi:hypothetical protein